MAYRPTQRRVVAEMDRLAKQFEPRVAAAFLEAVKTVHDQAALRKIADALAENDLPRVLEVVGAAALGERLLGTGLEPGAPTLRNHLFEAFQGGAVAGADQLPRAARLGATLDLTNPEAVAFLRSHLPELITEVTQEQVRAVQQAVTRGFTEGRPIPQIAREVRASVGLTTTQETYVANFRRQLETGSLSGQTTPWARRLSAAERASARAEFFANTTNLGRIDRLTNRYRESLVNRRAQNIARTEVHRASIEGQQELWRQATEQGYLEPARTRRHWVVTPDDRLRPDHAAIPGMNPEGVGLDEPFDTPVGPIMNPGEGPASFAINCRCATVLSFTGD